MRPTRSRSSPRISGRGLAGFAWECSLRTWAYTLARRASFRATRRTRRDAALESPSAVSELVQKVRTETLAYTLRTEAKSKIRALRDSLPEEDRALLMLRVTVTEGSHGTRLARVLSDEGTDDTTLKREAARLRKRFQLVKEKLKVLAKQEGIYPTHDEEER